MKHKILVVFSVFIAVLLFGAGFYYYNLYVSTQNTDQELFYELLDEKREEELNSKTESETSNLQEEPAPSNILDKVSDLFSGDQDPRSKKVEYDVPFTSQAPFADWDDPRQQDGCEEASSLMAVYWAQGKTLSKNEALEQILAISAYQEEQYSQFHDSSAFDTYKRIIQEYLKFENASYHEDIDIEDIIDALYDGGVVIVPANGQLLGNPYFTAPGPWTHMLVIKGYNPKTNEFITNDPGTRRGEGFEYDQQVLFDAIRNYETGYHIEEQSSKKVMIVVRQ